MALTTSMHDKFHWLTAGLGDTATNNISDFFIPQKAKELFKTHCFYFKQI